MTRPRSQKPRAPGAGFAALLSCCRDLHFERHDIARKLDKRRHYGLQLDREFPFHIALFQFRSQRYTPGPTWHERLELFLPLDGPARLRMGEQIVDLKPGDLLVVDNLKLHNVEDFPEFNTRVVVVSFMPEFVYSLGSSSHDYALLLPFYARLEQQPHVLRSEDALAVAVYAALIELLHCYFHRDERPYFQAGCKANFLQLLYQLARRFQGSEILKSEFLRQQERSERLTRVFDFIRENYAGPIRVTEAARLVHMSESQFMKVFKRVSGMTFVAYLTHVRLANAMRLLKETERTIAEIANSVGFSDQSYFDRRFRQAFAKSPRDFRNEARRGDALALWGGNADRRA